MDCQCCSEVNSLNSRRKVAPLKIVENFSFFLLNPVLNIKCFNDQVCSCDNGKECLICKIKRICTDFEYDLYKNMFDLDFLTECNSNLYHYLNQPFQIKKHCVCSILRNDYHYVWKDWFNGKNYLISLSDAIKHKEEHDINKIKNNTYEIKLTNSGVWVNIFYC